MYTKYSNKYFKKQVEVNEVWRKFMNEQDIYNAIERVKGSIAFMSNHQPHKLNAEDMEFMEKPLAELETGLRKINNNSSLFNFTEEQLKEINDTYEKLQEKIEQINLQRISWN